VRIQGAGNLGTLVVPSGSAEVLSADSSLSQHDSGVEAGHGLQTKTKKKKKTT
jgi:hypothetical protein